MAGLFFLDNLFVDFAVNEKYCLYFHHGLYHIDLYHLVMNCLDYELFFQQIEKHESCSKYFSNFQEYELIEEAVTEYKSYLSKLKQNDSNINKLNSAEKSKLQNAISSAKRILN